MYSDKFVEELMTTVKILASQNRELMQQVEEFRQKANSLRYETLKQLAYQLPPYPADGNATKKKEWIAHFKELLRQVSFED